MRDFLRVFHLVISLDFLAHNPTKNRILYVSHNFLSWAHFRFSSNLETIWAAPFLGRFLSSWSGVGRATLGGENSWFANFNLEAYLLGDKFSYNLALFQFFSNLDCLARFPIF